MGGHHRSRSEQSSTPSYSSYRRSSLSSSVFGHSSAYEVPHKSSHKSKRRQISLPDVLKYRIPGMDGVVWTNLDSWTDGRVHAVDFGKKETSSKRSKGCKCSSSSHKHSKSSSRPAPILEHRGHRRRATIDDLSSDFDRSMDLSSAASSIRSMGIRSPMHRYSPSTPLPYAPSPPVSYASPSTASYSASPSMASYQSPRAYTTPTLSSRPSRSFSSPQPYIPYSQAPPEPRSYVSTASSSLDSETRYPSSSWSSPPSIRSYATPPSTYSSSSPSSSSRRSSASSRRRTPSLPKSYAPSSSAYTGPPPSLSQSPKPYFSEFADRLGPQDDDQPPPPYSQLSSRRGSLDDDLANIDAGEPFYGFPRGAYPKGDDEGNKSRGAKDDVYIGPWDWPEEEDTLYGGGQPEVAEYPYDSELVRDMETPSKYSRSRGAPIVYIRP